MSATIMVSRDKWGALPPKERVPLELPAKRMSFKYTETRECTTKEECIPVVQALQKRYLNKGYPDLPYNFLIGGDMRVYEGRGWKTKVYDEKLLIGYIGKENEVDFEYMDNVMDAGYQLMNDASWMKYLMPVVYQGSESQIPGL